MRIRRITAKSKNIVAGCVAATLALAAAQCATAASAATPPPLTGTWENVTPKGITLDPNATAAGQSNNYGVANVVGDSAHPGTFYTAVTYQGFWKSVDWGATWTKVGPSPFDNGRPALSIAADGSYIASVNLYPINGATNGFWKTTNGGASWSHSTVGAPNSDDLAFLSISPFDKNRVIASAHSGAEDGATHFYESRDAGKSWKDMGGAGLTGHAVFYWVDDDTLLAISDGDNGAAAGTWRGVRSRPTWPWTWSWSHVGTEQHWHGSNQGYTDPTTGTIFIGGGFGVQKSTDKGLTWTIVEKNCSGAIVATPTTLYSTASYASNVGYGPCLMHASRAAGGNVWAQDTGPAAMNNGWFGAAVGFDGTHYVIVSGNWNAGIWRYVER
jgi:hypothetical protein